MTDVERAIDVLNQLRALGVKLSIDDFGTGYSSLSYLKRFPIDVLKIDRSFVEAVGHAEADPVLARAIIALGRTLQIETIAEGIERSEQRDGLRSLGCTLGQGYYFAKAMPAPRFVAECLNHTFESMPTANPEDPRLPHRRRTGAAAGGWCRGSRVRSRVLQPDGARLS
jgi:EAL domain-containing protein (putative c-di-GMP-specific phosphodiesterase class I)